jgi:hypothetical protein
MRRIAIALLICLGLTGCPTQTSLYSGKCTIEKVDGVVTEVKVYIPARAGQRDATFRLNKREDLDELIASFESILYDLKLARDQMKVHEPPAK